MKTFFVLLSVLFAGSCWEDAVLYISGASSIEELSQTEMERFENLRDHPLPLNSSPRGKLLASGLFSPYQIAAISEYRYCHGDILSFSELALVDGIPADLACALKYFVTLESRKQPGERSKVTKLSGDVAGKASVKASGDEKPAWSYGVKSRFDFGDRAELCVGNKSFSATYFGNRHIGKIVLGDFNAKFAQGLVFWSGFSLSGFHTSESFSRNGNGISPCCSFSSDHNRGIAMDLLFGNWSVALLSTIDGQLGGNVSWTGKSVSCGVTFSADVKGKASAGADFKFTAGRCTVSGEGAVSIDRSDPDVVTPSGVLGANLNLGYQHKLSATVKYDKKWINAIGYQRKWLFASLEHNISSKGNELKLFAEASHKCSIGDFELTPSLRWQEKLSCNSSSNSLRSEIRADVTLGWMKWKISTRLDLVKCSDWAFLTYLEGGYVRDKLELWLRPCLFLVDNWSDRIYCYEKDAPGAFNVPAFRDRGFRISAYSVFKYRTRHKFHLRLSSTSYFSSKKPSFEAKMQYALSF